MSVINFEISSIDGGYLADSLYRTGIESIDDGNTVYEYEGVHTTSSRYTLNSGVDWTDWESGIFHSAIGKNKVVRVQIKFIGDVIVTSQTLDVTLGDLSYPSYESSFLNEFYDINDPEILNWSANVLQKLSGEGILPKYLERSDDFNTFWASVTHLFAIFLVYFRQFEDIENNSYLLQKFVESLGLYINDNPTLEQLDYLFENYIDEFKKRGTPGITSSNTDDIPVDGEAKRVINYQKDDEYIFALLEPYVLGWNVGLSSPTFNYCTHAMNLIKGYENTRDVQSLDNYPTTGTVSIFDFITGYTDPYERITGSCLYFNLISTLSSGIQPSSTLSEYEPFLIPVDPNWDYEITFFVKLRDATTNLLFSVNTYDSDKNLNPVGTQEFSSVSVDEENQFFSDSDFLKEDNWYFVRGLIKNQDAVATSLTRDTMEFGYGRNLQFMSTVDVKYIIPTLVLSATSSTVGAYIYDFKVRPAKFNFSLGLLGVKNIIWSLAKNSSSQRSDEDVLNILSQFLVSYRNSLILKNL